MCWPNWLFFTYVGSPFCSIWGEVKSGAASNLGRDKIRDRVFSVRGVNLGKGWIWSVGGASFRASNRTQKSHKNGGDIFKKGTVCVKCYMLQLSFEMQKLLKKQNRQLGSYTVLGALTVWRQNTQKNKNTTDYGRWLRSQADPGSCTSCKSWSSQCVDSSVISAVV